MYVHSVPRATPPSAVHTPHKMFPQLHCQLVCCLYASRLKVLPLHQVDPNWRFQEFLQSRQAGKQQEQRPIPPLQLQQQQQPRSSPGPMGWRDLYWLTWGHVTVLYCQQCHQHFPARQYTHCSSHPQAPVFASGLDAGVYPCCRRPAWRPGLPLAYSQGCCASQHQSAVQQQLQEQRQPQHHQKQQQQQSKQQGWPAQQQVRLLAGHCQGCSVAKYR